LSLPAFPFNKIERFDQTERHVLESRANDLSLSSTIGRADDLSLGSTESPANGLAMGSTVSPADGLAMGSTESPANGLALGSTGCWATRCVPSLLPSLERLTKIANSS
jgi:hypothetical protein